MSIAPNTALAALEADQNTCVVRVPKNVTHRKQIIECFKTGLNIPGPFGNSWDALDESLNNLSWLQETTILVIHEEFPKLPDDDFGAYLDILDSSIEEWRENGAKRLMVVFG